MSLQLYKGDCLQVMKSLPEKSIDCFVCDLPFGQIACSWDSCIDLEVFWSEVERLMKHDRVPIIMFCTTKFGFSLIQSKRDWFRYDLIWEKPNAVGFMSANKMPLRAHEMIYIFSKQSSYYERIDQEGDYKRAGGGRSKMIVYGTNIPNINPDNTGKRCVRSVLRHGACKQKDQHPTQKPISLYKWLVERYCPIDGTMLDPTAGSFNSCLAAVDVDRNAIGIEQDEYYFKRAVDKFSEVYNRCLPTEKSS